MDTITVAAEELAAAAAQAEHHSLSGLRLRAADGCLTVAGSDGGIMVVSVPVACTAGTWGPVVVPNHFTAVGRLAGQLRVGFDGHRVTVTGHDVEYAWPTLDTGWPHLTTPTVHTTVTLEGLRRVAAAAKQTDRTVLASVDFDGTHMVATDSYRLAAWPTCLEDGGGLVPVAAVQAALRLEAASVGFGADTAVFRGDRGTVTTIADRTRFPDWRPVYEEANAAAANTFRAAGKPLADAAARAAAKTEYVTVTGDASGITLTGDGYTERVHHGYGEGSAFYTSAYLSAAVSAVGDHPIVIRHGHGQASTFTSPDMPLIQLLQPAKI